MDNMIIRTVILLMTTIMITGFTVDCKQCMGCFTFTQQSKACLQTVHLNFTVSEFEQCLMECRRVLSSCNGLSFDYRTNTCAISSQSNTIECANEMRKTFIKRQAIDHMVSNYVKKEYSTTPQPRSEDRYDISTAASPATKVSSSATSTASATMTVAATSTASATAMGTGYHSTTDVGTTSTRTSGSGTTSVGTSAIDGGTTVESTFETGRAAMRTATAGATVIRRVGTPTNGVSATSAVSPTGSTVNHATATVGSSKGNSETTSEPSSVSTTTQYTETVPGGHAVALNITEPPQSPQPQSSKGALATGVLTTGALTTGAPTTGAPTTGALTTGTLSTSNWIEGSPVMPIVSAPRGIPNRISSTQSSKPTTGFEACIVNDTLINGNYTDLGCYFIDTGEPPHLTLKLEEKYDVYMVVVYGQFPLADHAGETNDLEIRVASNQAALSKASALFAKSIGEPTTNPQYFTCQQQGSDFVHGTKIQIVSTVGTTLWVLEMEFYAIVP